MTTAVKDFVQRTTAAAEKLRDERLAEFYRSARAVAHGEEADPEKVVALCELAGQPVEDFGELAGLIADRLEAAKNVERIPALREQQQREQAAIDQEEAAFAVLWEARNVKVAAWAASRDRIVDEITNCENARRKLINTGPQVWPAVAVELDALRRENHKCEQRADELRRLLAMNRQWLAKPIVNDLIEDTKTKEHQEEARYLMPGRESELQRIETRQRELRLRIAKLEADLQVP